MTQMTSTDTATILGSLALLDGSELAPAERLAQAWMFEEIERRHPEITPALEAWAEDTDSGLSYFEAMLAALPLEAVA